MIHSQERVPHLYIFSRESHGQLQGKTNGPYWPLVETVSFFCFVRGGSSNLSPEDGYLTDEERERTKGVGVISRAGENPFWIVDSFSWWMDLYLVWLVLRLHLIYILPFKTKHFKSICYFFWEKWVLVCRLSRVRILDNPFWNVDSCSFWMHLHCFILTLDLIYILKQNILTPFVAFLRKIIFSE